GCENLADDPFRFADPHVEDLRPFDVHEIFAHVVAALFPELFSQVVGGRLADERLAAAWRTVKQKAFRRGVLKFLEQLRMNQRQLDRVLDGLERRVLATDFAPRQLWYFVQIMFARLRMGEK